MLTDTRMRYAALTAVFLIVMLGFRQIAHAVVEAGFIPWLALMGGIFAFGIWIENRSRRADGRAPYSLAEAREIVLPLACLAGVLTVAYCWR